jgi:phytoene synthase
LALAYAPAVKRPALTALFAIDAAMGEVVRTSSQPMLGQIRLAWWRERLEALDTGAAPPPEPRLRQAADALVPLGVRGHDLTALEDGWVRLFDPFPWTTETATAIAGRGATLFAMAAKLLGSGVGQPDKVGKLWALVDAARHCSDGRSRTMLLGEARTVAASLVPARFPRRLRSVSMLAALAARDLQRGEPFEPEGSPARAASLLRHALTGRLPIRG